MQSESARMSSAAEARFRVPTPATVARTMTISALDPAADDIVARLAEASWTNARFFPASAVARRSASVLDEIARADLAVMVTTAGADASAAAAIGEICSDRRVHTATFVVGSRSVSDEALSRTLGQVRPWSLMVVIAGEDDYVEDILRSFR
ncbi:MAG: hypothetical protein HYY76_19970 [Acidobacteria bacterium]|nr:hypothetical protein [Acidobacteriota bacterium]